MKVWNEIISNYFTYKLLKRIHCILGGVLLIRILFLLVHPRMIFSVHLSKINN